MNTLFCVKFREAKAETVNGVLKVYMKYTARLEMLVLFDRELLFSEGLSSLLPRSRWITVQAVLFMCRLSKVETRVLVRLPQDSQYH